MKLAEMSIAWKAHSKYIFIKMKRTVLSRKLYIILYLGQCCLLYGLFNAVMIIAYNDTNFTISINQSIHEIACYPSYNMIWASNAKYYVAFSFCVIKSIVSSLELYGNEIYSRKHL